MSEACVELVIPYILSTGRLIQEDWEFEVSLGDIDMLVPDQHIKNLFYSWAVVVYAFDPNIWEGAETGRSVSSYRASFKTVRVLNKKKKPCLERPKRKKEKNPSKPKTYFITKVGREVAHYIDDQCLPKCYAKYLLPRI